MNSLLLNYLNDATTKTNPIKKGQCECNEHYNNIRGLVKNVAAPE